jgi:signal recognition particle subunit SRP72
MDTSTNSLASLLAQTSLEDHNEVLKAANAAIKKSKTDLEAHHARAVALLNLDRFDDAADVFKEVKPLQEKARFEYAYALYKTGDAAKAVEVLEAEGTTSDRGVKHVLAQAVCGSKHVCAV